MRPGVWLDAQAFAGVLPAHPYVRRYWTALIGPGAVADLLRLTVAAVRGNAVRRPLHLDVLAREGLVAANGDELLVRPTVPPLSKSNRRRLPVSLRAELEGLHQGGLAS